MPTRMIDGDALWRSDKLAQVQPPEFRAEYANLIPLALADGTFECNPRRVWADVYSYNRPDIDVHLVEKIIKEFIRVGLLKTKTDENNKVWGFWNGIESRLPSESTRERYKNGKSSLFNQEDNIMTTSRPTHDIITKGLDRIGLDKDRTGEKSKADFQNLRTEYKKAIGKSCSNSSKNEKWYLSLCKEYGEPDILAACALWAEEENWRDKKPDLYFFFSDISRWVEAARADKKPEETAISESEVERINREGNEQARTEAEKRAAKIREDEAAAESLRAEPFAC